MVLQCDCLSPQQDKPYGQGKRVHNELKPGMSGQREARCTVCEKVKALKKATGGQ